MCDQFTDADSAVAAARGRLSRRQFGLIGAAAAVATAGHGTGANGSAAAAPAAGRAAEVAVYPADHGWCTIDAPVYDAVQAEKAWGWRLVLFGKL